MLKRLGKIRDKWLLKRINKEITALYLKSPNFLSGLKSDGVWVDRETVRKARLKVAGETVLGDGNNREE